MSDATIATPEGIVPSDDQPVSVSVRTIQKSFGDKKILDGVTFDVPAGSTHVIIGPSGGGKSTLLRCLAGLETIDDGSITIGDQTVTGSVGKKRQQRMRNVGMIFQGFELFPHKTALQNVELSLRMVQKKPADEARALATAELTALGLQDHKDKLPGHLSGGQKQRVAIARALALRPGVLLFDEPTSALDPELVGGVLALMKQLASEGMTMVVVTHEMQFAAEVASTVMFVSGGEITEMGAPRDVFDNPQQDSTKRFLSRIHDA